MAEISRRALIAAAVAAPVVAHAAPLFRAAPPRIVTFADWFWSLSPRDTPVLSALERTSIEATRVTLGSAGPENVTQIMRKTIGGGCSLHCLEGEEVLGGLPYDGDRGALEDAVLHLKRDMEFAITRQQNAPEYGSSTTPRHLAGMPFWGSDDPAHFRLGVLWGPELLPLTDRRAIIVAEVTIFPSVEFFFRA